MGHSLCWQQVLAGAIVLVLSVGGTIVIVSAVKAQLGGLRPTEAIEVVGLNLAEPGEEGDRDGSRAQSQAAITSTC